MKKRKVSVFRLIKNVLDGGKSFGYWMKGNRCRIFSDVLYPVRDRGVKYYGWSYFGSAAQKATCKGLRFILNKMFGMRADEFLKKYEISPEVRYVRY